MIVVLSLSHTDFDCWNWTIHSGSSLCQSLQPKNVKHSLCIQLFLYRAWGSQWAHRLALCIWTSHHSLAVRCHQHCFVLSRCEWLQSCYYHKYGSSLDPRSAVSVHSDRIWSLSYIQNPLRAWSLAHNSGDASDMEDILNPILTFMFHSPAVL